MKYLTLLLIMATAAVAGDLKWSPEATLDCLHETKTTSLRGECIGRSAEACMTPDLSTYAISSCQTQERDWWDARLASVYRMLFEAEAAAMEEFPTKQSRVFDSAEALREFQRNWILYRDAACAYEYSQYAGGTLAGPAGGRCLVQLTGEQTLRLERRLEFLTR